MWRGAVESRVVGALGDDRFHAPRGDGYSVFKEPVPRAFERPLGKIGFVLQKKLFADSPALRCDWWNYSRTGREPRKTTSNVSLTHAKEALGPDGL